MSEPYGPEGNGIPTWEAPPGAATPANPAWASPPTSAREPQSTAMSTSARPSASPAATAVPTFRSWQPGFLPLRPLSLGDFLSFPMKAMQFNRAAVVGGPLLCVLFTAVTTGIAAVLFFQDEPYIFNSVNPRWLAPRGETWVAIVIAIVSYLLADAAARAFVIPGVSKGILGQKLSLGEAWAIARPRVAHILGLYGLALLIFLGGYIVVIVVAIALASSGGGAFFAFFFVLGFILLAIIGSVLLGIAVNAIVLERVSAPAGIRRALKLAKKNVWRLVGCTLVIGLVLGIIQGTINSVGNGVLTGGALYGSSVATATVTLVIYGVVTSLISSIFQYSFFGSVVTLMYVDLRIRTEGFDVDLAQAAEAAAARR